MGRRSPAQSRQPGPAHPATGAATRSFAGRIGLVLARRGQLCPLLLGLHHGVGTGAALYRGSKGFPAPAVWVVPSRRQECLLHHGLHRASASVQSLFRGARRPEERTVCGDRATAKHEAILGTGSCSLQKMPTPTESSVSRRVSGCRRRMYRPAHADRSIRDDLQRAALRPGPCDSAAGLDRVNNREDTQKPVQTADYRDVDRGTTAGCQGSDRAQRAHARFPWVCPAGRASWSVLVVGVLLSVTNHVAGAAAGVNERAARIAGAARNR